MVEIIYVKEKFPLCQRPRGTHVSHRSGDLRVVDSHLFQQRFDNVSIRSRCKKSEKNVTVLLNINEIHRANGRAERATGKENRFVVLNGPCFLNNFVRSVRDT